MLTFSIILFSVFVNLYVNISHLCHADTFEKINKKDNNDNCESLVRRFADLEMSKTKISLFRIYKDRLNEMNNDEPIENADSGDREKTVSISPCSFLENNSALSQTKRDLKNGDNFEEYSMAEVTQRNNTVSIQ